MIEPVLRSSIEALSTSRVQSIAAVRSTANGRVEILQRLFPDPLVLPRHGRIVEQDVDLPEFLHRAVDHGADIVLAGDIAAHPDRALACGCRCFEHQVLAPRR